MLRSKAHENFQVPCDMFAFEVHEISLFSAICFIAGYMEISMYLALCFFKSAYTSTVFQIDKDYPNLPNVFKIGKIN